MDYSVIPTVNIFLLMWHFRWSSRPPVSPLFIPYVVWEDLIFFSLSLSQMKWKYIQIYQQGTKWMEMKSMSTGRWWGSYFSRHHFFLIWFPNFRKISVRIPTLYFCGNFQSICNIISIDTKIHRTDHSQLIKHNITWLTSPESQVCYETRVAWRVYCQQNKTKMDPQMESRNSVT